VLQLCTAFVYGSLSCHSLAIKTVDVGFAHHILQTKRSGQICLSNPIECMEPNVLTAEWMSAVISEPSTEQ
jgi:hypothetical protein